MKIPTRRECLELMTLTHMPDHIRRHSEAVAMVAVRLAQLLNQDSVHLDLPLLEAGALLHDIAKAPTLNTDGHHGEVGAKMLEAWGYGVLAPIVKEHVLLEAAALTGPITESLVVNYADKRVKHDHIVTLTERFDDLISRYARTEEHRRWLQEKYELYLLLESKLFAHLAITPQDLAGLCEPPGETIP